MRIPDHGGDVHGPEQDGRDPDIGFPVETGRGVVARNFHNFIVTAVMSAVGNDSVTTVSSSV